MFSSRGAFTHYEKELIKKTDQREELMIEFIVKLDWALVIIACLTLGLAPFIPEPHLVEKLRMLSHGELVRPIDWFDLLLHGTPWLFLIAKVALHFRP